MQKAKQVIIRKGIAAEIWTRQAVAKLREESGNGEQTGGMIMVLIAVVIGAIIMGLFGDTIKSTWDTLNVRIADLFNYK